MKKLSLTVALLFCTLLGCGRTTPQEHADDHGAEEAGHSEHIDLTPEAAKIAGIEIREVRRATVQDEITVPGTVTTTSGGRAMVTPSTAGQILRIFVKVGDAVQAGQAIANMQSPELAEASVRISEAEASLMSAEATARESKAQIGIANARLRAAEQQLKRQAAFAKTGAFSQPALQAAQKELADAEAELERGKQDQSVHEAQLERAERLYKQELISRTDLEQARLEVATDKIRQRNAERRIELATATFERERRIADQGLSNSKEIQTAEAEVRASSLEVRQATIRWNSAVANVASVRKQVKAARASYRAVAGNNAASGGTLTIKAPISGVIVDLHATIGQAVERTTELCEIENLRSVWVNASVSDKQVRLASVGGPAKVSVSGYPGRVFSGVVQIVGKRLDPKTRALPLQVLVDNGDGALRSGMSATVRLGVGYDARALVVPRSAVLEDGDLPKVYVARGEGEYEEQTVQVGRTAGDLVEIVSGLEEGERVVTKGAFVLKSEKAKGELKGHEH